MKQLETTQLLMAVKESCHSKVGMRIERKRNILLDELLLLPAPPLDAQFHSRITPVLTMIVHLPLDQSRPLQTLFLGQ